MKRLLLLSLLAMASCSNDEESNSNPLSGTRWYNGITNRCGRESEVTITTNKLIQVDNLAGAGPDCLRNKFEEMYNIEGDTLIINHNGELIKVQFEVDGDRLILNSEFGTSIWFKY